MCNLAPNHAHGIPRFFYPSEIPLGAMPKKSFSPVTRMFGPEGSAGWNCSRRLLRVVNGCNLV